MRIAVLGAGVTGLAASLALARDGHDVVLVERDEVVVGQPLDGPGWKRQGIPHFLQAHAFASRGRRELNTTFPDVYDALIAAGADDTPLWSKLRGEHRPQDDDLAIVGVRRPLVEWALRRAVVAQERIRVESGVTVEGLEADPSPTPVVDMRYENPFYMAEDAGAADLIAGGRLQLGISRGSPADLLAG